VTLVGDEGPPHPPKRLGESRRDPCPTLVIMKRKRLIKRQMSCWEG